MTPPDPQSLSRLRALLRDTALPPEQLLPLLANERQQVARNTELEHEQVGMSLRWLQHQPEAGEGGLAGELRAVRHEWLALRVRGLVAESGGTLAGFLTCVMRRPRPPCRVMRSWSPIVRPLSRAASSR